MNAYLGRTVLAAVLLAAAAILFVVTFAHDYTAYLHTVMHGGF